MLEAFDFNSYTYKEMDITIDPALYNFENAPTTLNGVFKFTIKRSFMSGKAQQIVTMNGGNIIYTREYDAESETFSDWITNEGEGAQVITAINGLVADNSTPGQVILGQRKGYVHVTGMSSTISPDVNYVAVGADGITITLPAISAVLATQGPLAPIEFRAMGSGVTSFFISPPDGSTPINGLNTPYEVTGAENGVIIKNWPSPFGYRTN